MSTPTPRSFEDDLTALPPCTRADGTYACQRLGCDAYYAPGPGNVPGSCVHHTKRPCFRDGVKSWPCCGKSSHDFGEFMSIKGCASGTHTCAKITYEDDEAAAVVERLPAAPAMPLSMEARARGEGDASACVRCKSGFYCAEHANSASPATTSTTEARETTPDVAQKVKPEVDLDTEQTCKNPGCGRKFRERDNADDACEHHSGAPIFHETEKGWSCCGKLVYDFDDFLKLAPCARGRHDADAKPIQFQSSSAKKT